MASAESFAKAMETSDLGWSEIRTKPVELAAAMSGASGLASDIFRAKGSDTAAIKRAVAELAFRVRYGVRRKLKRVMSREMATVMAELALLELIKPKCRACHGAGVMILGDLKIECQTCGGVQVHRYSDAERARACGVERGEWHRWVVVYAMFADRAVLNDDAAQRAQGRLG